MAQKVMLTCDVDGDDTEAEETVRFGLDGREYEIDLCTRHHNELNGELKLYVEKGRKIDGIVPIRRRPRSTSSPTAAGRGSAPRPAASAAAGSSGSSAARPTAHRREDLQTIRSWGRAHGMSVSDRGRISAELSEAYAAAHR